MTKELDVHNGNNDCDGSELKWQCPKCGHKNGPVGDCYEWLRGDNSSTDFTCDGCNSNFMISVFGDFYWRTSAMMIKEIP